MKAVARCLSVGVLIVVAVTLQVSVFDHFSLDGVVPDLVMLMVIAAALSRGADYGAFVGFAAGLVLDLAPPADHVAGRWTLAMLLVGYLTGLARGDARPAPLATVLTVAAGVFVGNSVFALTGFALGEPGVHVADVVRVVPLAVCYDVALTPLVVPLVLLLFRRIEPGPPRW